MSEQRSHKKTLPLRPSDWLNQPKVNSWFKSLNSVLWDSVKNLDKQQVQKVKNTQLVGSLDKNHPMGWVPYENLLDEATCLDIKQVLLDPSLLSLRAELNKGLNGFVPGVSIFSVTDLGQIEHLLSLERSHNKKIITLDWVKEIIEGRKKLHPTSPTIDVSQHDHYCVKDASQAVKIITAKKIAS